VEGVEGVEGVVDGPLPSATAPASPPLHGMVSLNQNLNKF
jgi:hypothetical protein